MKKVLQAAVLSGLGFLICGSGLAADIVLAPVVVTAARMEQATTQTTASVTVIDAASIKASGASRVEEVLRDVVGLQLTEYGTAGAEALPSLRGSEGAQVLVLLDGVRLNSPQNGRFDLSALPIALGEIERIEVLRGPASALYGSNALGGVIQIFTRQPQDGPRTRLGLSAGRFDTRRFDASIVEARDAIRYRFGAFRKSSDGDRENSDLDQIGLNGAFGFDLPRGFDLEVNGYYQDKETGVPGSTKRPSPQARQYVEDGTASLRLEGPLGPVAATARVLYRQSRTRFEDRSKMPVKSDRQLVKTLGAELQGETAYGRHALLFGSDFYRDRLDSSTSGDREQKRWSLFGQDQIELAPRLQLLLGGRYDAHADFRDEFSPRAGLLVGLTKSTTVRASAGKAYRAPTLNDRFWPDTGWARGNPALEPETAWEYELSLEQQLAGAGSFSLGGFRRDARDLIDWRAGTDGVWTPSNVDRARIWGVEAEVHLRPYRLLAVEGNYAWLYPKNTETNAYLTDKLRHQASLHLEIGPLRHVRLRLSGRYGQFWELAGRSALRYRVFDASLGRRFRFSGGSEMELMLTGKNLLDEVYEVKPGYPMAPRELVLSLSYAF